MKLILRCLFLHFCAIFCLGLQARGTVITTPGLSISFNASAVPDSVKNASGTELLSGQISEGFYLQEADNSIRRFNQIADLGGGVYRFSINGAPEQFEARFGGAGDYLTIRFSAMSGFALAGEKLKFRLYAIGAGLQAQALDHMISVRNTRSFVELERISLWESSPANPLGGFAVYQYVNPAQEDETLLDLWVNEGLPHPKVAGTWDRAAANAWLDAWIVMARDTGYLNIVPSNLAEHSAFLPHAKAMDAKAIYLWNLIWRGEYWLNQRQNDEINPLMYPGGLTDLQAFKNASGRGLMLHYLSGNIGEEDVEFTKTTVSPDLQSWGAVTLNSAIGSGATTMIVTPDASVRMPVISTSAYPTSGPPTIPSFFDFKTFRIGSEWLSASSVTDLGNGTWQLNGVARGKWNTAAQSHPGGTSLRGYLRPYNEDFVPDPNSPLMATIATRWANLCNTLGTSKSEFDGFEDHTATGLWGAEKFAALVYENLDHPTSSNTSNGNPPAAWIEYKINRVKDALGGPFQTRQHASLFLGDHSQITPGIEELENELNKFLNVNNRGFSLGSYDVTGVSSTTLARYGQTDEVLALLKNWKNASLPMTAAQRGAMDTFRPCASGRSSINGNHEWATALWRLDGALLRKWHALGTDIYTHEWHFGQEHGTITPRFYLKNGQTQNLAVPSELATGAQQTRIIGRVLPRYEAASASNIDLMGYLGGSSVTVARSNTSAAAVWDDTALTSYPVNPACDLRNNRGLGLWVTGDGSGATLVIRLRRGGSSRDHVVPINFTGRQWIEIPTGEQGWRVRNWGWAVATRQTMDYQWIDSIAVGIGHLPANTSCSVLIEGLTALAETHEALVAPTLHLGEQSLQVTGTIATGNHFILDPDGTFTIYDERWKVVSVENPGNRLLPVALNSFRMQSASSANIWLEVGVQASNETTTNPDPAPPVTWDGGGVGTAWSTAANWDADMVPDSTSDVEVGSWASVSAAPNTFASLKIKAGATVAFGTDTVSGGKTFDIAGTLDCSGVYRLTNSTVKLSGHLGSQITFLDTNNSAIRFIDGAAFDNPGMSFEHKGTNTFGYKLSSTGFRKMTAGFLYAGNGAVWSNATYEIDISDYDLLNGSTVTLADYSGHATQFDGPFNPTVRVFAGSTLLSGTLAFDRVASALVLTVLFNPPTVTWDGGGGDASWTTAANWDADKLPGNGDYVIVGPGAAVTNGQTDFSNLIIRKEASVSFAGDLSGNVLDVEGTMNRTGVFRINNSTVNLSGSIGSSTTFLDTNGSTLNFTGGATFGNTAMSFEHKGTNTFGYKLSATGFQTLVAGRLYSGNGATWAGATYNIDISNYDRSNGSTIVLADYASHDTVYSNTFNPTVNIITGASGLVATLAFDNTTSRLVLTVNYDSNTIIWDGGGGDSAWTTAGNWNTDSVPLAANPVLVGTGASVTNGQNVFSYLKIDVGASVTFAGDTINGTKTVDVAGTLDRTGVLRFDSTMKLSGRLGAGITFLDTNGSTLNFVDGASFANANMSFEHKGSNTFGYKLSATGFQTLVAGRLYSGNAATWSGATYNIDISNYDRSNGSTIVLADYASHDTVYSDTFNPTVNIIAGQSGLVATLAFDQITSRLVLTVNYDSNTVIWDGGGGDSTWTTAGNWNTDSVPLAANRVVVGAGAVVSNGQNVFSTLKIDAGATVAFSGDTINGTKTVDVAGTLDRTGVLRFYSTMKLSGRLGPNITFLDTNGSILNFVDGASFANANMSFEHKGSNTFGYKLSATGFQTLVAGRLYSGSAATWANATYNIDLSDYDISNGLTIVLADYASHDTAYSGAFNPTVNIIAETSGLHGTLGFNKTLSQLVLTVDPNDAPTALNQSVSTPVNIAASFILGATDPEGDNLSYAIVAGPSRGTLSGTAPNLTYTPANGFIGTDTLTYTAFDGSLLSNTGTVTFVATPQTSTQLWASLDTAIRADPLNTEWQATWVDGAVTLHQIRYDLGTLTGSQRIASPKIAAYYAYPTGGTHLPGIVEIHGGGQRASVAEAKYWAQQGYACISINWGGLPLNAGLANTDWDGLPAGFVRTGVAHAIHREEPEGQVFNDGSTLFADAHPLNISYLLNAYAARRALTFLSSQGIVDSGKLGVTGHSMGGQTTVLTATDPRITCVTPSVGGSGYLFQDWWGMPGTARPMNSAHLDWYERTADPLSYWPEITCPTLFLQASNDFNAPFDLVTKAMALQNPAVPQRLAVAPHFNHRFDSASYASRVLWQKAHLTGTFNFPKTSVATLDLNQNNGIPLFSVWPDTSNAHSIVSVDIYYGYDRDSLTRFWRDAKAVETSPGLWQARCPVHDLAEPLAAFVIVTYDCGFDLAMPAGYSSPTRHFSVASEVKTIYPPDLANHGVRATETELRKIDDFSRGFHDWFILNPGHPTLFEFWTRKLNDPTWTGKNGSRLSFEVTTTTPGNTLGVTLQTEQWNSSASTQYHATVALNTAGVHAVSLQVSNFTNGLNQALTTWDTVKALRLSAGSIINGAQTAWLGATPQFSNLRWEGGSYPEDFTTSKGTPFLWLYENDLVVEGDYATADLIDSDADGGKSWEEYLAGTNPNNPASAFKVKTLSRAGNQHVLEWQAVAGKTYSVWFSDNLTGSSWTLKEAGIPGVEPTTSATIQSTGARGFFRVGVAP